DAPDSEARHETAVDGAGRPEHHVSLVWLEGDHQAEGHRRYHVDPKNLRGRNWHGEAKHDGHGNDRCLCDVGRQHEEDGLLDVVVDGPPFLHGSGDGREVVVGQDHFCGFLRDFSAFDTHGDADVCPLEGGRVVHTVAGHRHDLLVRL